MSTVKCFFYGSLRDKGYNAKRMRIIFGDDNYKLLRNISIPGYKLYDTGLGYPAAIECEDKNCKIVVEEFEVSPKVMEYVRAMEFGAGYKEIVIEGASMFIYKNKATHFRLVENGDWMKHLNLLGEL